MEKRGYYSTLADSVNPEIRKAIGMITKAQKERITRFTVWADTFEEDGVYPVPDNEIGIVERSWRWAYRNPERVKKQPQKKGDQPKKA